MSGKLLERCLMGVKVVIPTVKSRTDLASSLALRVGGEMIIDPVGDGSERSATDNHVRAMLSVGPTDDWVVILEDDADPIDDFQSVLRAQLSEAPTPSVVSLYLGQGRPKMIQKSLGLAINGLPDTTSWLKSSSLHWGVGVCIPGDLVDSVAEYALSSSRPWDQAVGLWAMTNNVPVLYTWPSLVDHIDEETTIVHADGQEREPGRKAWRVGTPPTNGTTFVLK